MSERVFQAWAKIPRLEAEVMTITEKIDGTNACIVITEDDIYAQSRTRIITPEQDNHGFARWVEEHKDSLRVDLGVGRFYGEWFGAGIQRKYGMDDKWFALFNAHRFVPQVGHFDTPNITSVPILHSGPSLDFLLARQYADWLYDQGSRLVPGFMKPEGVVIHLKLGGATYKITDAKAGEKLCSA